MAGHVRQPDRDIGLVANAAGVSEHQLRAAFRKADQTPLAAWMDLQMGEARWLLNHPTTGLTVDAVARIHGFAPGRFATDYQKRFGECPHDTLMHAKQRTIRSFFGYFSRFSG